MTLYHKKQKIPNGMDMGFIEYMQNSIEGELLYIGKGGTAYTDGNFTEQQLKRHIKNKKENMHRKDFFSRK